MIVDKAWFQHDMAYGDLKDLTRKTAYDKILCDKAFNISKNPKYDGYLRGLASIVYECFTKKKKTLASVQINLLVVILKLKISQEKN